MTPEQFTYWLNGFIEIQDSVPTPEQWIIIKKHMGLVMHKPSPVDFQKILQPSQRQLVQPLYDNEAKAFVC